MKIENNAPEAYVSKNVEVYQASIAMTKEVFNILVKGIYKDPYKAVVRELICNARDAQVEADVNTPLEIHLPTAMEPFFAVKDNGLGMSQEMVTRTFMQLGTSTKRESNKLIGQKGIGSKSPFSIVDAYSVNSVYDGVKTSYSIYMNKGIPDVAVLMRNETTEQNGVEINVGIPADKISTFNVKVKEFLAFFDYPVKINIPDFGDKVEKPAVAFEKEYNGFTVKILGDSCPELFYNKVVMGGVAYDSAFLENYHDSEDVAHIVEVPIGAVDISPGREYTEEVDNAEFTEKLKEALEACLNDYYVTIDRDLDTFNSIIEACNFYKQQMSLGKSRLLDMWGADLKRRGLHSATVYKTRSRGYRSNFRGVYSEVSWYELLDSKIAIIVKDKGRILKRAELLHEQQGYQIICAVDEDDGILSNPMFSDVCMKASDIIIPSDIKKERSLREKINREKGHVVYALTENGVIKKRLSKDEFSEVESFIVRDQVVDNGNVYVNHMIVSNKYCDLLEYYDVPEVYLLTERQAKWVTAGSEITLEIPEDIVPVLEENYVSRHTNYNQTVEKINYLRNVKGLPGTFKVKDPEKVPNWVALCKTEQSSIVKRANAKADKLLTRYKEEYSALIKQAPVLQLLGDSQWSKPEVKSYIKMMRGNNERV